MLSDLRQCGKLEEDAAFVGMLYRPSYYKKRDPWEPKKRVEARDPVEFIIAKNRHGSTETIPLIFLPHEVRFEDVEVTDGGN
jgi:replicative DNA helicase